MGGEPLLSNSSAPSRTHLDLFAAVLLARPFDAPDERINSLSSWAGAEASRAVARGRASAGAERSVALKLLYGCLREEAARVRAARSDGDGPRWEKALRAVATLRHRQRAAVTLRYVLSLEPSSVADVIGVREREIEAVLRSALASAARTLGGPDDVRRALRVAGARLLAPEAPERPVPAPARMPRAVVRTLLASPPPVPAEAPSALPPEVPQAIPPTPPLSQTRSPVEALLARAEAEPPDITAPPKAARIRASAAPAAVAPAQRNTSGRRTRWVLAPAFAVLLAAVLIPASARDDAPGRPPGIDAPARSASAAPRAHRAEVAGRALVVVRPGDSLWRIAATRLHDPLRWTEVWRRNRGRLMATGERFLDPDLIRPGWRLILPTG